MTRAEKLTLRWLEDTLSSQEREELARIVETDAAEAERVSQLLELEANLRGQLAPVDLVPAVMDKITRSIGKRIAGGVIREVRARGETGDQAAGTGLSSAGKRRGRRRAQAMPRRTGRQLSRRRTALFSWRVWASVAACVAVVVGASLYSRWQTEEAKYLLVLNVSDAEEAAKLLRGGRRLPVRENMWLHRCDRLSVPAGAFVTLQYRNERTTVRLLSDTRVTFGDENGAKHIQLGSGTLVCDVAKQPEGRAMVLTTPHARATILGTRFTLSAELDSTRLVVTEGTVELARPETKERVLVGAGRYAVAAEGRALVARRMAERGEALAPAAPEEVETESEPTTGPNLLVNPGFENGLEEWQASIKRGDAMVLLPSDFAGVSLGEPHTGRRSLALDGPSAKRADPTLGPADIEVRQEVRVDADAAYYIEGWIKCRDTQHAGIHAVWRRRESTRGRWIRADKVGKTEGTHGWRKYSRAIKPPRGARVLAVSLGANGESGAVWFDDLHVEKMGASE